MQAKLSIRQMLDAWKDTRPLHAQRSDKAMGRVRADGLDGVAFFMQGSNTMWSATAMLNDARDRVSLVTCNDGRPSVTHQSANLAMRLLAL